MLEILEFSIDEDKANGMPLWNWLRVLLVLLEMVYSTREDESE